MWRTHTGLVETQEREALALIECIHLQTRFPFCEELGSTPFVTLFFDILRLP